ncbi:Rv3235 family protein [Micromonospora globbae]|uniref:Rv3235 family protein n=1 Tax=Micromonospora globbae TaxID=1894969 RepID=A0ABZ1S072_9ACTN|nr:Rv3235 family protein [Micromonospora globbae]
MNRRPGPSRPPVRLRPAPPLDPPYADEDTWSPAPHGQLALDLFASTRPDGHPPQRRLRPVPPGPGRGPAAPLPPAALVTASPEATRAAHRFVGTCVEVLNGYRPPHQLRALLDPARAHELLPELSRAAGRTGPTRRRTARATVHLRRLRAAQVRPDAVEVAAVLTGAGGRSWALALRLEHRRGRWLCVALHVL